MNDWLTVFKGIAIIALAVVAFFVIKAAIVILAVILAVVAAIWIVWLICKSTEEEGDDQST